MIDLHQTSARRMVRVKQAGTYRIITSVLPVGNRSPSEIREATARLFAFLENLKPQEDGRRHVGRDNPVRRPVRFKNQEQASCFASRERRRSNGRTDRGASLSQRRMEASTARKTLQLRKLALRSMSIGTATKRHHLVPLSSLVVPELPGLSGLEILCKPCHFKQHGAHHGARRMGRTAHKTERGVMDGFRPALDSAWV